MRAMTHVDMFKSGTNMRAWLREIMRNRFFDGRRSAAIDRFVVAELRWKAVPPDQEDHIYAPKRLARPSAHSKSIDRDAIMTIAVEGLSHEDGGALLGITGSASRSRLHDARKNLGELVL